MRYIRQALIAIGSWVGGAAQPADWHARPKTRRAGCELLERREVLATLTANEQFLLELINSLRADPVGQAAHYGLGNLNKDLPPGTITATPKQPLAPNDLLRSVARAHSDDMRVRDYFSHESPDGVGPGERASAAGYAFWSLGENLAFGSYPGWTGIEVIQQLHGGLINSAGHRQALLNGTFDEVGVGIISGTQQGYNNPTYNITELFGWDGGARYLTGVVYSDVVFADRFYTPGEGLAGVQVIAQSAAGQVYQATTGPSGGYALPLPAGNYSIRAEGGGLVATQYRTVALASQNVKLDFTNNSPHLGYLVQEAYDTLLNRPASFLEIGHWAQRAQDTGIHAVLAALAASSEYYVGAGNNPGGFVVGVYQDFLGRTPANAEIASWASQIMAGTPLASVATAILSSGEFSGRVAGTNAGYAALGVATDGELAVAWTLARNQYSGWLRGMYEDLLGRGPADAESLGWTRLLADGLSRQQVVGLILNSDEYLLPIVGEFYQQILGRGASGAELASWANQLRSGVALELVEAQFLASAEFFARSGGTNRGFVTGLYQQVLGRSPAEVEYSYWVPPLTTGALSRQEVALRFTASQEKRFGVIGGFYQQYLGRTAGLPELAGWMQQLQQGLRLQDIQTLFISSPEYGARHRI